MASDGIGGGGASIGGMIKTAASSLIQGGTKADKEESTRDSAYLSHNIAPEKIGVDQSIQPNFEKFA